MSENNGWIDVEHRILACLGASTSLSYNSQKTAEDILKAQPKGAGAGDTELAARKQRIVVGRDVYFLEAFFGFLFPINYPAVYVEITERKFAAHGVPTVSPAFIGTAVGLAGFPEASHLLSTAVGAAYPPDFKHGPPGAYLLKQAFIFPLETLRQFTDSDSTVGRGCPLKRAVLG